MAPVADSLVNWWRPPTDMSRTSTVQIRTSNFFNCVKWGLGSCSVPWRIGGELETKSKNKWIHLMDMSSANTPNTCLIFKLLLKIVKMSRGDLSECLDWLLRTKKCFDWLLGRKGRRLQNKGQR